jgi:Fe-S-cluster containining protein
MKIKGQESGDKRLMTWDDTFTFRCHRGLDCYNSCCRDVTIFLNPLDVGRLRNALGITSGEFLERYTVRVISEVTGIPAVVLKMRDDEEKRCPFVSEEGCTVYEARPYSCRMYPLDTDQGIEFRFIVDARTCHGLNESDKWTVESWKREQGLRAYDETDHQLADVMRANETWEASIQDPRMQDMIHMALYNPDRFREFVFTSSFLTKFRVDEDILEKIRDDDEALLYFAAQWLRFALFGKKGFLKIDPEYLNRKKQEVLGVGRKNP